MSQQNKSAKKVIQNTEITAKTMGLYGPKKSKREGRAPSSQDAAMQAAVNNTMTSKDAAQIYMRRNNVNKTFGVSMPLQLGDSEPPLERVNMDNYQGPKPQASTKSPDP